MGCELRSLGCEDFVDFVADHGELLFESLRRGDALLYPIASCLRVSLDLVEKCVEVVALGLLDLLRGFDFLNFELLFFLLLIPQLR